MTITLTLSRGSTLIALPDGTSDAAATSLTLLGVGASGYAKTLSQNFVWMLENFANRTPPANPITGQVWFDSVAKRLRVFSDDTWSPIGSDGPTTKQSAIAAFYMTSATKTWQVTIDDTGTLRTTLAL